MVKKTCNRGHFYDSAIDGNNCPFCPEAIKLNDNIIFLLYQVQRSHCFECKWSKEKALSNFGNNHCPNCEENFVVAYENTNGTIPRIDVLDTIRKKYLHKLRNQGYNLKDPSIILWEIRLCEAMIALSTSVSTIGKAAQQYIDLYKRICEKNTSIEPIEKKKFHWGHLFLQLKNKITIHNSTLTD